LPQGALPSDNYATVFVYHRFDDPRHPSTSISLEDFKKELLYLKRHGYKPVKISELYRMAREGKIPPKTVAITIDDGYKSTYKAFKLLKEFNFPFTVFLYMEAVDSYPDFLTKEQIKEMEESSLVEFESHLYSHPRLARYRVKLGRENYLKFLERESSLSEEKFRKIFGRRPLFLALPYGDYDEETVKFFKERGYKLLLTQDRGSWNGRGILVPRMNATGGKYGYWRFVRDLKIEPLSVLWHRPPAGLYWKEVINPTFYLEEDGYDNCKVYASGSGWVKGLKEGKRVEASKPFKLKKLSTRVGVLCTNEKTKRPAEFFYLIIKGAQAPQR